MIFYNLTANMSKIVTKMLFRVEVKGIENINEGGPYILACNHKSNWDAVILLGVLKKIKINSVAKKELFKNPILKYFLNKLFVIPIDREKPEISTIKKILKLLKDKESILIFPEGTRHKDLDSFSEVKSGIGMFALKGKVPVIPISIITDYKLFSKVVIVIDKEMNFNEYTSKKVTTAEYETVSESIMNRIKKNYFDIKFNKKCN